MRTISRIVDDVLIPDLLLDVVVQAGRGLDEEGGSKGGEEEEEADASAHATPSAKRVRGPASAGVGGTWKVELPALLIPGAPALQEGRAPFTARVQVEPLGSEPAGCRLRVHVVGGDRKSFWRFSDVLRADVLRNGRRWRQQLAKDGGAK